MGHIMDTSPARRLSFVHYTTSMAISQPGYPTGGHWGSLLAYSTERHRSTLSLLSCILLAAVPLSHRRRPVLTTALPVNSWISSIPIFDRAATAHTRKYPSSSFEGLNHVCDAIVCRLWAMLTALWHLVQIYTSARAKLCRACGDGSTAPGC